MTYIRKEVSTMANKMTYVMALDNAINGKMTEETVEKLTALKARFEKEANVDRKPTKGQVENEGIKDNILAYLADGTYRSATEVGDALGISNQKASALLKQLTDGGKVKKVVDKRKSYFTLA